ncbi:MAG: hypothetical protein C0391_03810 [Anaerolinea sp.]|nr:hypothetical protein [Anaerolinea sp.]
MKSQLYVRAYNKVRKEIKRSYRQLRRQGGWRAVGAAFRISGGMAFRIGEEGYMPSEPAICQVLGLPVTVEVEVNPKTGKVIVPKDLRVKRTPRQLDDMSVNELRWALDHREEMRG